MRCDADRPSREPPNTAGRKPALPETLGRQRAKEQTEMFRGACPEQSRRAGITVENHLKTTIGVPKMRASSISTLMKKLFGSILLFAALTSFRGQAQQSAGALAGFLSQQGLAGAKLERRFGNHLFVSTSINNKSSALMIDTGAPGSP
jgi:hypothetical protein